VPGVIIERERELEAVAQFLSDAEPGPGVLILAGEPGIGKTAVWKEAVRRARAAGRRVLSTEPLEAEAASAFAALADLLEPVIDDALAGLPEPQRRALAVALLREDPGPRPLDPRAVSAATSSVLRNLARSGPVVIAIDDVQWLDRPSAHVLQVAIRRQHDLPVTVLAAERLEPGVRPPITFEGAVAGDRFRRLDLSPLTGSALHELLEERLGRPFSRRIVERIDAATAGNPFFALEIARSLPEGPRPNMGALPMPDRLLALVETRIQSFPRRARLALLAAAALSSPTVQRVRAAAGGTSAEWRQALADVEANGIIEVDGPRMRFTHPILAAAVYASATADERRRMHRKLATLAEDIEERARHAALGADTADADLAAVLDRAADHARARGAPGSAAELLGWARTLTPEHRAGDVLRRTVQAAEYWFHAGELQTAREQVESVLREAPAGQVRARALGLLGEIRYREDSFPGAVRLFEEALEHVADDRQLESTIQLSLGLCFRALGDFIGAESHTRRAVELTEQLGDGPLHAVALAVMARLDVLLGRGLDGEMLARALALEDPNRQVPMPLRPSKIAGDLFLYVGELERSVRILERERERLLDRGEESDLPFVLTHLTWAECWRGHLSKAAAHADESLQVSSRVGGESVHSMALVFAALVAAHQGDSASAHRWAEQGLALARSAGWHTVTVWGSWALGALAVSVEDAPAAHAALGPLTEAVEKEGLTEPVRAMFLAEEIEALIALGELDRAASLADLLEGAGTRLGRGWAVVQAGRCQALLLAARGDIEEAAQAAHDALTAGENLELRLEMARTLLVAGQIERRRRRKAAARSLLGRALEIFEGAGAVVWAGRARLELERAAARPAGNRLTVSEQRVAALAASGLTNREVAAQLFMSAKTVEAHLSRVYRKLGIRSRAELGARLGAAGSPHKT